MRIQAYLNWFINKKYTYYFLFTLIHIGFMLLNRKLYAVSNAIS